MKNSSCLVGHCSFIAGLPSDLISICYSKRGKLIPYRLDCVAKAYAHVLSHDVNLDLDFSTCLGRFFGGFNEMKSVGRVEDFFSIIFRTFKTCGVSRLNIYSDGLVRIFYPSVDLKPLK